VIRGWAHPPRTPLACRLRSGTCRTDFGMCFDLRGSPSSNCCCVTGLSLGRPLHFRTAQTLPFQEGVCCCCCCEDTEDSSWQACTTFHHFCSRDSADLARSDSGSREMCSVRRLMRDRCPLLGNNKKETPPRFMSPSMSEFVCY
jgi:hypothetical protein